ncbi:hypothetical protein ACHQM5_022915 [Ranunculus cassubicifolius]
MTVNNGNAMAKQGDVDFLDFGDLDVEDDEEFEFSGLCVPQDPIEDLEWFPSFKDDMISLNNFDDKKQSKSKVVGRVVFAEKNCQSDNEMVNMVPSKKPRSKRVSSRDGSWSSFLPVKREVEEEKNDGGGKRVCLHCGADSTPLWRMGPLGPNTLCNACGVRYRTGRLVPEYRPLNSPSYDRQLHSNSHKKIMKMRKGVY